MKKQKKVEVFIYLTDTSGVDVFFFSTHKQDTRKVTCEFERCTFYVKETKRNERETKEKLHKRFYLCWLILQKNVSLKNISH